jgi:hypothetical protein
MNGNGVPLYTPLDLVGQNANISINQNGILSHRPLDFVALGARGSGVEVPNPKLGARRPYRRPPAQLVDLNRYDVFPGSSKIATARQGFPPPSRELHLFLPPPGIGLGNNQNLAINGYKKPYVQPFQQPHLEGVKDPSKLPSLPYGTMEGQEPLSAEDSNAGGFLNPLFRLFRGRSSYLSGIVGLEPPKIGGVYVIAPNAVRMVTDSPGERAPSYINPKPEPVSYTTPDYGAAFNQTPPEMQGVERTPPHHVEMNPSEMPGQEGSKKKKFKRGGDRASSSMDAD